MKTKLWRFVSILSAMVLMILCAVPAFADDTSTKTDSDFEFDVLTSYEDNYYIKTTIEKLQSRYNVVPNERCGCCYSFR